MKYFDLSESDSWKMHTLLSPRLVPKNLTKHQVEFCLILYDKVYPQGKESQNERLFELWSAIRTLKEERQYSDFLECLAWVFNAKMADKKHTNRSIAYIEFHLNYADSLPPWQRNEYLRRIWGV